MAYPSFYIDRTGKIVIDASRYEGAANFSDGLAPVLEPGKGWGFIDKTGAFAIQPQFESALCFSEGLAAVLMRRKWGFIDNNGIPMIDYQFESVNEFSEGVAVVQRSLSPAKPMTQSPTGLHAGPFSKITEHWNLLDDQPVADIEFLVIDTAGNTLINLETRKLEVNDYARFSEGLLGVYSPENEASGYVNKSFEFVIQPRFAATAPFTEGLARVAVLEDQMEKLAFIDKSGDFVIPPSFNTDFDFRRNSSGFSEGLAAVSEGLNPTRTKEETFVYIDKAGEIVLATDFFYSGEFREGLAAVYNADTNKWGFIDKTGAIVIPVKYEAAQDFSDGLALVSP